MFRFTKLTHCVIPLWAISLTFICSCLMVGHWVSLPTPTVGTSVRHIANLGNEPDSPLGSAESADTDRLTVTHILYSDCPCSRKVLNYLLERPPLTSVNERVVLVGHPQLDQLETTRARFEVEVVTPVELVARYRVEAAPLMIVFDGQGVIQYAGGYTSRKQGIDYQDQAILQSLLLGKSVDSLPVYGCAVSSRLKRMVDPLSLK